MNAKASQDPVCPRASQHTCTPAHLPHQAAAACCAADLMDGPEGFDLSKGTWKRDGWAELDELRKKLEDLKELRELVRSLGRGGGKGPLRLAPEEVS